MRRVVQGLLAVGITAALAGALVCVAMAAQGEWRAYYANDPIGRNVVVIESRAPLETIVTTGHNVVGEIHVNPQNVLDKPQARFELDLASLDTGIPMRNGHMKTAMWLDTAKYPTAVFTAKTMYHVATQAGEPAHPLIVLAAGQKTTLAAQGTLELHGVTRPVTAQIEVTPIAANADTAQRLPGDLLHVRATFPLKLDDYGIIVDPRARLKVANEQQVTVDIFSSTELPKPPAGK